MAKQKFVVRDGYTFGKHFEYGPGDELELDEAAGVAFADKLKPAGKPQATPEEPKVAPLDYLNAKQQKALQAAGYATQKQLDGATDDQLRAVEGIGDSTLAEIRAHKVA